jgi:hypothetical protein
MLPIALHRRSALARTQNEIIYLTCSGTARVGDGKQKGVAWFAQKPKHEALRHVQQVNSKGRWQERRWHQHKGEGQGRVDERKEGRAAGIANSS